MASVLYLEILELAQLVQFFILSRHHRYWLAHLELSIRMKYFFLIYLTL